MPSLRAVVSALLVSLLTFGLPVTVTSAAVGTDTTVAAERHLTNIRQLTVGGNNTGASFSFDGSRLIFQSTNDRSGGAFTDCSQIYVMDLDGTNVRRVSTGYGGATSGYFFPGGRRVLYASTHLSGLHCPPGPPRGDTARWALDNYELFSARLDGREVQRLTFSPGYDADATIAPNGKTLVFTSVRDGDIDLYSMKIDGTGVTRLTDAAGYDGGARYSPDSARIVYRAQHPATADARATYHALRRRNLVAPGHSEIFVMNADGSDARQVTNNGASNVAPVFHPDGRRIVFSSSGAPLSPSGERGRPSFHLYMVNDDGTGLEQLTTIGRFNGVPMLSPDGAMLVWISDRHATAPDEYNVFLADWTP